MLNQIFKFIWSFYERIVNIPINQVLSKGPTIQPEGGGGGLWFFAWFRIFFSDNTRVRIFIFFCQAKL